MADFIMIVDHDENGKVYKKIVKEGVKRFTPSSISAGNGNFVTINAIDREDQIFPHPVMGNGTDEDRFVSFTIDAVMKLPSEAPEKLQELWDKVPNGTKIPKNKLSQFGSKFYFTANISAAVTLDNVLDADI